MAQAHLLTVNEVAELLGKRPETIRRWIAAGKLESVRDGSHVRIPSGAVDALRGRLCEHCGKSYAPDRPTKRSRFCSDSCRWKATYLERKAKNPAKRKPGRPRKNTEAAEPVPPGARLAKSLKCASQRRDNRTRG